MAMQMGGDDFIAKPFDQMVMTAKIQAVLRRTYDYGGEQAFLEHKGAVLNMADASLSYEGEKIDLTKNEYPAVKCDKLRLEMTIQRLVGGSWANVKTYSDVAYNASLLSKSYNYSVKGGYYYRVKAACIATKGGTTETQMPVTNGIWID